MIRVIVADDHPLVRAGLRHVLADYPDLELSAEVENGAMLMQALTDSVYDVVLLDMFMPGRSGIELIKLVRIGFPTVPIIVLSTHKEDLFAVRAIKAGANGYICKDHAASNLIQAIRQVAQGEMFITRQVAEMMSSTIRAPANDVLSHKLLTDREYQVFLLLAEGCSPTNIAESLHLSIKTVSTHKARIKEKMSLANDTDLVRYALEHDLIQ